MPTNGPDYPLSFTYTPDEAGQPALAIIEAVSWVQCVAAEELEPLSNVVDAELLNGLFEPGSRTFYRSASRSDLDSLSVAFQYEGCQITVDRDRIYVEPDGR